MNSAVYWDMHRLCRSIHIPVRLLSAVREEYLRQFTALKIKKNQRIIGGFCKSFVKAAGFLLHFTVS